jgi:hypothetical protein
MLNDEIGKTTTFNWKKQSELELTNQTRKESHACYRIQ